MDSDAITLQGVTLERGGRCLLSQADARYQRGELTALIGRNGSGKSSLLRAIAGLDLRYTGEIRIAGEGPLSRRLAIVCTGRAHVPAMRCRDVVALGRAPYTDWIGRLSLNDQTIVDEALEAVGMTKYAARPIDTLSDGEAQRIMIARALAQDTPVILLDEPTSFLDIPGRRSTVELLASLAHEKGKCILFSTHELDLALQKADNVALISSQRLTTLPSREMATSTLLKSVFDY